MGKQKTHTHGGARLGAGRPAVLKKPRTLLLRLERTDHAELQRIAKAEQVPLAVYLRRLVEKHLNSRRRRNG